MRGGGVKVEVAFFHVLPVVPLGVGRSQKPVPSGRHPGRSIAPGQNKAAAPRPNTAQAIFIPAIDAGARLIMIEVFPGIAVRTIVFPNGSPGALGEVRPPQTPVLRHDAADSSASAVLHLAERSLPRFSSLERARPEHTAQGVGPLP